MAASEDDESLDFGVDDLEGLRAELDALREEFGDGLVSLPVGVDDDEGPLDADWEVPLAGAEAAEAAGAAAGEPASPNKQQARGRAAAEQEEEEEGGSSSEEGSGDEMDVDAREPAGEEEAEAEAAEEEEAWPLAAARGTAPAAAPAWAAQEESEDEEAAAKDRIAADLGTKQKSWLVGVSAATKARRDAAKQQQAKAAAAAQAAAGRGRGAKSRQKAAAAAAQPAKGKAAAGKGGGGKRRKGAAAEASAPEPEAVVEPVVPVNKLQAVREALEANRQLQARLRRLLASTDRAIERNASVLLQVRGLHAQKNAPPAVATVPTSGKAPAAQGAPLRAPTGVSQFWGAAAGARQPPPPYPDAETLKPVLQFLPYSFRSGKWSEEEQQRLRDGVLQLVQELQLGDVMLEMQQRVESGGSVGLADYESSKQRIAALTLDSPVVCQLAAGFREEEWARLVQRTRLQRTTAECRLQWTNCLSPGLSQQPWSSEEDGELQRLAERYRQRQWETVARELASFTGGPPRPPLACLQRHQQLSAAGAKEGRQFSTQEGVARLAELVAKHGNSWKRIAEEFGGGWEPDQLMHIWRRHAQRGAEARRGKWSQSEDDALLKAMALHGRKWSLVAKLVTGRTDVQCRERYMNVLNPEVKTYTPWTDDQDEALTELVAQHTQDGRIKWSAVAAHLPGRTDKHCAWRWRMLQSGNAHARQPKSSKKKAGGSKKKQRAPSSKKRARPEAPAAAEEGEEAEAGAEPGAAQVGRSKRRRPSPAAAGAGAAGEAGLEGAGLAAEHRQGEEEEEQEEGGDGAASAVVGSRRRPQRQRRRKRWSSSDESGEETAEQAEEEAGQEEAEDDSEWEAAEEDVSEGTVLATAAAASGSKAPAQLQPAPPQPTSAAMPCTRRQAVGRRVSVWWVEDEGSGAGRMYPGRVAAWDAAQGVHAVHYDGEEEEQECQLEEETVEWLAARGRQAGTAAARLITGPGAPWPEDASRAAAAATAEGATAQVGGGQQEAPAEQQGQRPARQRRASARALEAEDD